MIIVMPINAIISQSHMIDPSIAGEYTTPFSTDKDGRLEELLSCLLKGGLKLKLYSIFDVGGRSFK